VTITQEKFQRKLGREICRLRLKQNKTQEQLAGEIGIHRNSLARYEAGADVPVIVFYRICNALGTHAKDVLEKILPDAAARIRAANGLDKKKEGASDAAVSD